MANVDRSVAFGFQQFTWRSQDQTVQAVTKQYALDQIGFLLLFENLAASSLVLIFSCSIGLKVVKFNSSLPIVKDFARPKDFLYK